MKQSWIPLEWKKVEMFLYTLPVSECWLQELEIGVKGLLSTISGRDFHPVSLDKAASHPLIIDSLQDLMDITMEIDTRYHERQKEKSHHQEKNPEALNSNLSHPQNSSSSSQKKKKNFQKRDKPNSSLLNKYFKLMNSENKRRIKEGLCTYCGGKHILESCFKRL
ncbi:hypothetical protein O181_029067 [Austropuccinia psidii MF-1]|uniref:Uncharacterized protein n=1 Tax=Austropuccinia psidii MF-1 TaxID=1389203 RepID=A0A9Q3CT51_9BASI|nr:hypothetical protein [Austropuccinia psidii MF-1]